MSMSEVTLSEAQSHIDGIVVAKIITDWSTTIGKEYGSETRFALSAVGPVQGLIGLAIKNKHLFIIDDPELLDSRNPYHPTYGTTEQILRKRYDENVMANRQFDEELSNTKRMLAVYRWWFVFSFAFPFLMFMLGFWSFN